MEKKKGLFFKAGLVVLIIISSCLSVLNMSFAYEYENVGDYPTTETITYNGKAVYLDNIVGDFTLGGKTAFCMQHPLATPPTGTKLTSKIYKNDDIRKVLYYGYDGVKPWSGIKNREHGIVVTSLALSYYYHGDNSAPSTIKPFIDFIKGQSVPSYSLTFSKTKVSAYKSGNIQRTESITLQSGSDASSLTIAIPSQVTYVDETHGTSQKGGQVTIYGKTTFHFEAPLQVKLDSFTTGTKTSSYEYQPIVSEPSSSVQTIGRGVFVSDKAKTTSLTVDWLSLGSLELTKTDISGHLIDGAIFRLWNNDGFSQDVTVNNGKIKIDNLSIGHYFLQEKVAPSGYLLDDTIYSLSLSAGDTTTQVIANKEPLGNINLQKQINIDKTNHLIGDAYLKDNEYGLYAREDIQNASHTQTYYKKDQLISQKKTDVSGKISWTNLHLGKYYIKELNHNQSVLLDTKVYDVSLTYQNMSTSLITENLNVKDDIASQHIQIFKEGTKDGVTGVVQGLSGAEFSFVLNSEFEKVGFEKAKKYFVGTTDKNGYLTTSALPYGTYRVKETKTPVGYYGTSDFLVTIEKDASMYEIGYQIKKMTVNNLPFESLIKIVKLDKETGKTVQRAGATFKIKNLDTNEYVSYIDHSSYPNSKKEEWHTHDDGTITLNAMFKIGRYQLEETKAPEGYTLNQTPVVFEITEESYELSSDQVTPVTLVKMSDQVVKGRVTFDKRGEVLSDFQEGKFIYQMHGLSDVQFEITAKENIVDPSLDGTILYKKGDVIEVLTTDKDGKAMSSQLPLGEYEYREIKTPLGYMKDEQLYSFSLTYKDQETNLILHNEKIINERQKVDVRVLKKDAKTNQPLANAHVSLIANRDVYNFKHELIVKAGTFIETLVTKDNGEVKFENDLPIDLFREDSQLNSDQDTEVIGNKNALFFVEETQAPLGYILKKARYYVDTIFQQEETVISHSFELLNQHIPVETLGDEPPIKTEDTTILMSYILMGIGAFFSIRVLFKNKDE